MEPKDYAVAKIEGEYAILKDTNTGEELLLPWPCCRPELTLVLVCIMKCLNIP